jgi:chloramphenicol-sensitive protein RarD
VLIAVNWFVYIYGVVNRQVVQTSLGYFINPLINVLLGMVFFHERLRGLQWLAVALAAAGVLSLTVAAGQLPWIALTLGLSFGLYGLIRKTIPTDGLVALSVESLVLLPLALGYLAVLQVKGLGHFATVDRATDLLLALVGVITVVPLLCFGQAARKLPLSTLGFIQYLSPTCQFLLAVLVLGEELDAVKLVSFCFIWLGLVLFSTDTLLQLRQRRLAQEQALMPVEGQG